MKQLHNLKSKTSIRKLVLSGIVLASGMVGTAQAASTLISGPLLGGPLQNHVTCLIVNAGPTPITILSNQFVGNFSGVLPIVFFDNCKRASLAPGGFCNFQANVNDQPGVAPNQSTLCKVVILEPKTNVRGTIVAVNPDINLPPLDRSDLR